MSKSSNKQVSQSLKKAIEHIPEVVKQAVIHKYLKYMKMIFMSKVMVYRKTIHRLGFKDFECMYAYKRGRQLGVTQKMRSLVYFFKFNEFNIENKIEQFLAKTYHDFVKEIPPLLDPVLCKDLKTYDKAITAH